MAAERTATERVARALRGVAVAATLLAAVSLAAACAPDGPAAAGGTLSGEDGALQAILDAWERDDCATVLQLAPGFVASTDLRLDAVTYRYGRCFYRTAAYADAAAVLAPIAGREPPTSYTDRALYFHGRSLYRLDRFADAAEALARVVDRFHHSAYVDNALYYLGRSHYQLADDDAALARFDEVLGYEGSAAQYRAGALYFGAKVLVRRAEAAVADGESSPDEGFETAILRLQSVLADYGDGSFADDADYTLAKLPYVRGRYEESAATLASFLERRPDSGYAALAHYFLGRSFERAGQWDDALAVYGEHAARFPASAFRDNALYHTGRALRERAGANLTLDPAAAATDRAAAAGAFEELLAAWPDSFYRTPATYCLGRVRYDDGAWSLAAAAFAQVLGGPDSPWHDNALYYAGMCAYHRGKDGDAAAFDEAVSQFDALLAEVPESSYADGGAYFRGRSLYERARLEEASAAFEAFPAVHAGSPYIDDALYYLVRTRIRLGDCAGAAAAFARMQDEVPDSALTARAAQRLAAAGC